MKLLLAFVATLMLVVPVSAATITAFSDTQTIISPAADDDFNQVNGSTLLSADADQVLSYSFRAEPGALDNNGGLLELALGATFFDSDLFYVEAVSFAVDAFGTNFLATSGLLGASEFGTFGVTLDFSAVKDQLLEVYFFNDAFGTVSNPGNVAFSLLGTYDGDKTMVTPSPVPLPASVFLLLAALGGMFALQKQRSLA
jgi:hypothetical protein